MKSPAKLFFIKQFSGGSLKEEEHFGPILIYKKILNQYEILQNLLHGNIQVV